ncbi:MAG: bifunctional proline dehydrogenase/L-glutamate gamma-semialdehyde dehydrogenase PutA [Alphaproteobacteria bacterium]|nr:bifunctional proline dehydrogenase/L-glutamate gamma-semialdehyde dehydrogenase PutA [Alphaproteobacteria bacterium]
MKNIKTKEQLRKNINLSYRADETKIVQKLLSASEFLNELEPKIHKRAYGLVKKARATQKQAGTLDAFMYEYSLSNQEGIVLMCLAESLLRVPDKLTANKLIKDKILSADWEKHIGQSESIFVNASTWALMLTGQVIGLESSDKQNKNFTEMFNQLIARSGRPFIRKAILQAMKILGGQFIIGETIEEALTESKAYHKKGYSFSYDMLGEAARTKEDVEKYEKAYQKAIIEVGAKAQSKNVKNNPGISIKLSALHPRYEFSQHQKVLDELLPRLINLAKLAKSYHIGFTIDAEESERLNLSLDLIEKLIEEPELKEWDGLGIVVQAYHKCAIDVLEWLYHLGTLSKRKLMIRLVKGAYWDTQIKYAQERGLSNYTVFTRKPSTDLSYLVCAKKIISCSDIFYPQFATHNAHTVATILELANNIEFEFQRLYGMGDALYSQIAGTNNIPVRIYAPVGGYEDLLAYLVRRLLENGANTSFVNRLTDDKLSIDTLITSPQTLVKSLSTIPHPDIPLPENIYGNIRKNSKGIDLANPLEFGPLHNKINAYINEKYEINSFVIKDKNKHQIQTVINPANFSDQLGHVVWPDQKHIDQVFDLALKNIEEWHFLDINKRIEIIEKASFLLEEKQELFISLIIREAGRTINDAIAEVREAVDFCRYYALCAKNDLIQPFILKGSTGESNQLTYRNRGIFVCISPWNFPLAIFMGQVVAALITGNAVLAKPSEQTSLIAWFAVNLLFEAGVPRNILYYLPGSGKEIGNKLVQDPKVAGVAFTGSVETAWSINRNLAARSSPIARFIAETGGQNVMIVDSTALPEQVVRDLIISSFQSAGQRCSACRVAFVQEDIADRIETMLIGAMQELVVGNPALLKTDVGPVIDQKALEKLNQHIIFLKNKGKFLSSTPLSVDKDNGYFFAPHLFQIEKLDILIGEVFGPILHLIRWQANKLDHVIQAVNAAQFGLTLGIHSRIEETIHYICKRVKAGNIYVNRNMIGAVVGVQPFGGVGLSGTGPKAGGPNYLHAFTTECSVTVDLTATGGNADLLSLHDKT